MPKINDKFEIKKEYIFKFERKWNSTYLNPLGDLWSTYVLDGNLKKNMDIWTYYYLITIGIGRKYNNTWFAFFYNQNNDFVIIIDRSQTNISHRQQIQ